MNFALKRKRTQEDDEKQLAYYNSIKELYKDKTLDELKEIFGDKTIKKSSTFKQAIIDLSMPLLQQLKEENSIELIKDNNKIEENDISKDQTKESE